MAMKRVWYQGKQFIGGPRMGGIVLSNGEPVDVPEDLAAELVASGDFVDTKPITRPEGQDLVAVVFGDTHAGFQVVGATLPQDLSEIAGIGPTMKEALENFGITTVPDLAQLNDNLLHEIADNTPGISKSLLRRWRLSAQA